MYVCMYVIAFSLGIYSFIYLFIYYLSTYKKEGKSRFPRLRQRAFRLSYRLSDMRTEEIHPHSTRRSTITVTTVL